MCRSFTYQKIFYTVIQHLAEEFNSMPVKNGLSLELKNAAPMSNPDASVLYVRVGYSTTEEIDNRNIYTQVTYFAVQ